MIPNPTGKTYSGKSALRDEAFLEGLSALIRGGLSFRQACLKLQHAKIGPRYQYISRLKNEQPNCPDVQRVYLTAQEARADRVLNLVRNVEATGADDWRAWDSLLKREDNRATLAPEEDTDTDGDEVVDPDSLDGRAAILEQLKSLPLELLMQAIKG